MDIFLGGGGVVGTPPKDNHAHKDIMLLLYLDIKMAAKLKKLQKNVSKGCVINYFFKVIFNC